MKKFKFYALLIAMITFAACSDDDFDSQLTTDLETDSITFAVEGGVKSFKLESNEAWMVGESPEWLSVEVKDIEEEPATRSSLHTKGKKEVILTAEANSENEERKTELTMKSLNGKVIKLKITQESDSGILGYWILSEGGTGLENSELAWYDVAKKELSKKQFSAINGKPLGDTGNEIAIYGSKMYVVITGGGFTPETTKENSYIEVINPKDGKSIKRIPFTNVEGTPAKPRNIIFEGGKGYITSYSNEVVRLDTALLTLDKHTKLGGRLAEGLTYSKGNLYISNGGQGTDSTISVVDVAEMKETKVIKTVKNPNHIVTVSNGDIYFNTDWPEYKLYKLSIADEKITEISGVKVADLTFGNNNIYTSFYDWDNSKGAVNEFNIAAAKATKLNLNLESLDITMNEYHIGTINGSDNIYLTGIMGDDVVIFDPNTQKVKFAFQTGVDNGSSVVAVYK